MKPQELRLGNFINFDVYQNDYLFDQYSGGKITAIAEDHVYINGIKIPELKALQAIPITEEWLLKFGFIWCDSKLTDTPQKLTIQISNCEALDYEDSEFFISDCSDNKAVTFFISPGFVHQLQNLYFALTGDELGYSAE